jgi:putative nucleotidyltransferase with HDIG domain
MSIEEAKKLLYEWVESPGLRKHCESVAASMAYFAKKNGEDVEMWTVAGLLHDFDYERFPTMEDHPYKGSAHLSEIGVDAKIINAIMSHGNHTGVARETLMQKTLFAVDELSGFVVACVWVRPDKNINSLEVASVKKKLKTKEFAAKVSREDIAQGAQELGVEIDDLIADVIAAQREQAETLGLSGTV